MLDLFKKRSAGPTAETGSSANGHSRPKPTLGIALGGGAARGFAHIGIMRALLARGIVPDVVVGTSMGAVVGGCYVAGKLDDLEDWALSLQKRNLLGYLDFSFSGSGLIEGGKLGAQLNQSLGETLIDDLPVKFAAIATEVATGHEIWLTHGRLVEAIRASYALPGIFSPVNIAGKWLVDGALVNPVPVSAARALGAEIVIACNVSTDVFGHGTTIAAYGKTSEPHQTHIDEEDDARSPLGRLFSPERFIKRKLLGTNERPGISTVMVEAFNIMQDRITRARLAGDPPDVLISPRVGRIGWFDFHRAQETAALGQKAAERIIDSIEEAIEILAPTATAMPGTAPGEG